MEGHTRNGTNMADDTPRPTGGQLALSGFLFQILRSLHLGLSSSAWFAMEGGDVSAMTLTLEPLEAGDARLDLPTVSAIEQMKMLASNRRWSTGAIAREVLPDLIAGTRPGDTQEFRFVTDNPQGLGPLKAYLNHRTLRGPATATFAWGRRKLSPAEMLARIARAAKTGSDDPRLAQVLDALSIVVIDAASAERDVEARLAPMLSPGQDAAAKRHELMGRLFEAASAGRTITAGALLALVGPDAPLRLQHAATIPGLSRSAACRDCERLGYASQAQARLAPIALQGSLTVLSGESGQGKTWSLCQSALAPDAGCVVVVASPRGLDDIVEAVNSRLWLPAFDVSAPLDVIARRLGRDVTCDGRPWLTLYIDDVQDIVLARQLAREHWEALGIRIVATCQPRVTGEIVRVLPTATVIEVGNFTGAELRRYLRHHGRHDALETMPDDVFELLLKPVHASVYVSLSARSGWHDVTEYELFKRYWDQATVEAREQYDHLYDRDRLADLAGSLIGLGPVHYPWRGRDLRGSGLDEGAIRRLEAVGLLRRHGLDRVGFSTDRMLNWAVAEHLASRVTREELGAAEVDKLVGSLDTIAGADGSPLGRRLGYVYLDLVWLLLREVDPALVADLTLAHVLDKPQERFGQTEWTQFGSVGHTLLPALEVLARRSLDAERDWSVLHHLPFAIVAAGRSAVEPLGAMVGRLLASGQAEAVEIGLQVAGRVPLAGLLDQLFEIAVQRREELNVSADGRATPGDRADLIVRSRLSFDALARAAGALPSWLDARIAGETRPTAIEQLLWCLMDDAQVGGREARSIWTRRQDHVLATLPGDSRALLSALGHFGAVGHGSPARSVAPMQDDLGSSFLLRAHARIDPETALEQVRTSTDPYGWRASDWWLAELHRYDAARLSQVLRENTAGRDSSGSELAHHYYHRPDLMDEATLEVVLDGCAEQLRLCNEAPLAPDEHALPAPMRIIGFLCTLTQPFQFDCVGRRKGTAFERDLVRFAGRRAGRTTRAHDTEGKQCERLLAMMGGAGHAALVVAELGRTNGFGREDGYAAARWSDDWSVAEALAAVEADDGADRHRQVVRLEALAIHGCDRSIETMLRAGALVSVEAVQMRSGPGRPLETLGRRIDHLLSTGRPDDLAVAISLVAFLAEPQEARCLLAAFLDPATTADLRGSIVGTMNALGFYDPAMLPAASQALSASQGEQAWFLTSYLARHGDAPARTVVIGWLDRLDVSSLSSARHSTLHHLLGQPDAREGAVRFVRRVGERGAGLLGATDLALLADEGDHDAREALVRAAYRGFDSFRVGPVSGILHLLKTDAEEAFFAAGRLLARHGSPDAVRLLFRIDAERAARMLLARLHSLPASLRGEVGRGLRRHVPADRLGTMLSERAASADTVDRRTSAELAGWVPSGLDLPRLGLPWLDDLAGDKDAAVRSAAADAIRRRGLEAAAMDHLRAMPSSPKPLRWARLQTIFEIVDPRLLWAQDDPAGLGPFLDESEYEFFVEAQRLHDARDKAVADAENADEHR